MEQFFGEPGELINYESQEPRNFVENDKGKVLKRKPGKTAWKFWKLTEIKVEKGSRAGTRVGNYITAKIGIGDGPKQMSPDRLREVLDGKPFTVVTDNGIDNRTDVHVEVGEGPGRWSRKAIEKILEIVDPQEPKRGPGRPKKNAGATDSGDGPASTGSTDSEGDAA
jgi:hypothetical protein